VARFEQILYAGVILNDCSREGSRVYRPLACHRAYPLRARSFASSGWPLC